MARLEAVPFPNLLARRAIMHPFNQPRHPLTIFFAPTSHTATDLLK